MYCKKCGTQLKEDASFCSQCGTPVKQPEAKLQKSKAYRVMLGLEITLGVVALFGASLFVWQKLKPNMEDKSVGHLEDAEREGSEREEKGAYELMLEVIEEEKLEKRSHLNDSEDLYFQQTWENISWNGLLGGAIVDLDGDDSEEAIVVYIENIEDEYGSQQRVLADIYTAKDKEAVRVAEGLVLSDNVGRDEVDICVYLKETADGYRLIGDTYNMYWHWADGGEWELYSYDCSTPDYKQIADYAIAGSALEPVDEINHRNAAKEAGLENVTQGLSYAPLLLQDQDIRMICNVSTEIEEGIEYYTEDGNPLPVRYGKIYFFNYTDEAYRLDDQATQEFINQEIQRYSWTGTEDYEEEYIFPNSDTEELTDSDLELIADNSDMLRKARNEIYARYGRMFQDEKLQAYFNEKSWYRPSIEPEDFSEDMLNETEKKNCRLIKKYEEKLK